MERIGIDIGIAEQDSQSRRRRVAFDTGHAHRAPVSREWTPARPTDRLRSRDERQTPHQLVHGAWRSVRCETDPFQVKPCQRQSCRVESHINGQLLANRPHAENGAGEQHQRPRVLCDHENCFQRKSSLAQSNTTLGILQGGERIEPGRMQRRNKAETDAHRQSEHDGGAQHSDISPKIWRDRHWHDGRRQPYRDLAGPVGNEQSHRSPHGGKQQTFKYQLPHQHPSRGAERKACGQLLPPLKRARQDEDRQVGHGDRQHQRGRQSCKHSRVGKAPRIDFSTTRTATRWT